jgi:hypothetical protein
MVETAARKEPCSLDSKKTPTGLVGPKLHRNVLKENKRQHRNDLQEQQPRKVHLVEQNLQVAHHQEDLVVEALEEVRK